MQTIYLDLAEKNATQYIYVKQGDVGRKFEAVILDKGEPYAIAHGTVFTVWYSGSSGEGNYSAVGDHSAATWQDNTVQVELITQMLSQHGGGTMCLMMHAPDGTQIALWNLLYICEQVPGIDSEDAVNHYSALSEVAQQAVSAAQTFKTDASLSAKGAPADAKAVSDALKQKAPAGFGIGEEIIGSCAVVSDLNSVGGKTGFYRCGAGTLNIPDDEFGGGPLFQINWFDGALLGQLLMNNDLTQMYFRQYKDGVWSAWCYLNPPMKMDVEYATMERWDGKIVYTKLINCGLYMSGLHFDFNTPLQVIRYCGRIGNTAVPAMLGEPGYADSYAALHVNSSGISVSCSESLEFIGLPVYCRIWYTKS